MVWVRLNEHRYPALRWFFHVPNGGARSRAVAGKLKAEGVRPGVFDYFLPRPARRMNGTFAAGLWLELKDPAERPKPTPEQEQFGADMALAGYEARVCYGWREAANAIAVYLDMHAELIAHAH